MSAWCKTSASAYRYNSRREAHSPTYADGQRDFLLDTGGVDPGGRAVRVRPADRVRSALLVVRHAVRVSRRPKDDRGRGRRRGGPPRLPARRNHRRRAAAAGRGLPAHGTAARRGPPRDARDRRPPADRPRARRGGENRRRQMPGQRRGGQEPLAESRRACARRRGEVRDQGPRGLRLREAGDCRARPGREFPGDPLFARPRGPRSENAVRVDARGSRPGAPPAAAPQVHLEPHDARRMRAVVLLSGGLDSYTAAAIARAEGFALLALTIDYGQRHACEIAAARKVARALGVERHLELAIDLRAIGGSSLTGDIDVPRD